MEIRNYKIKTEKYILYKAGVLYTKDGKYVRNLQDRQLNILLEHRWQGKHKLKKLDELLDGGDEAILLFENDHEK